ncbi:hypothetical protein CBR_g24249 [Chara braunii]|uniref:Transmembrane protein n=1 Tax=Chara braunii TaxID=69332 RepID=A0A388JM70_CHABU|nr:hypothetical protein CBR_g24249 [Chara braunii]|eukprot:GBG58897.1 hypothetical protein CBR_g24249 [Chara braunii]
MAAPTPSGSPTPNPAPVTTIKAPPSTSATAPSASASRAAQQLPAKQTRWSSFLYSGSRKHVALGLFVIGGVAALPWALQRRGKPLSHEDYQELAEKARRARLAVSASTSPSVKQ